MPEPPSREIDRARAADHNRTVPSPGKSAPTVLLVGAGLVGCAIAYELARAGLSVEVLERSVPGAEASSVAAGILAPRIEHAEPQLLAFGIASLEVHARWARELAARGLETGYRKSGALSLALSSAEVSALEVAARAHPGSTMISGAEAQGLEPALSPSVLAALVLADEAQVEPPRLLRALALAAEGAGARFHSGVVVRDLARAGSRVVGVHDEQGRVLSADVVVLAAGSWLGQIPGLPLALGKSVRPVRGQLVHLDTRRPLVSRVLFGAGGYVVPRADGRVIVGATVEEAGFDKTVTAGGAHAVLSRAFTVVPALAQAELVAHAVNFRPASVDERPLIGPTELAGLFVATGHFRNGILLAPATAELLADLILERDPRHDPTPFDPRRFRATEVPA